MGCDIHLFAERREGGTWRILPAPIGAGYDWLKRDELVKAGTMTEAQYDETVKAPYRFEHGHPRDPAAPAFELSDCGEHRSLAEWFNDRNYRLFGMLANVRNRDERVQPITNPRGVPSDASPEYHEEVKRWGPDGHSHTFFTVAELRTYFSAKYAEQFLENGCIDGKAANALLEHQRTPKCWSVDIMGRALRVIPLDDYVNLRELVHHVADTGPLHAFETRLELDRAPEWFRRKYPPDRSVQEEKFYRVFVRASWSASYNRDADRFLKLLDELEQFGTPEDIRVVFFFDN